MKITGRSGYLNLDPSTQKVSSVNKVEVKHSQDKALIHLSTRFLSSDLYRASSSQRGVHCGSCRYWVAMKLRGQVRGFGLGGAVYFSLRSLIGFCIHRPLFSETGNLEQLNKGGQMKLSAVSVGRQSALTSSHRPLQEGMAPMTCSEHRGAYTEHRKKRM